MSNILFLLANGFEEMEFVVPFDILIRGGLGVSVASINNSVNVLGAHGLNVKVDSILSKVDASAFNALVLPGGPGTDNLLASEDVKNILKKNNKDRKIIAAICAAPRVLANAGILGRHEVTSFPAVRNKVEPFCRKYSEVPVVTSENIITSRGAGTATDFAFAILKAFKGEGVVKEVKEKMQFYF